MAKSAKELLAMINLQLETILLSPQVDYTVGDKSFSKSQIVGQLNESKRLLLEEIKLGIDYPDAEISLITFDHNIDEMGIEQGSFER